MAKLLNQALPEYDAYAQTGFAPAELVHPSGKLYEAKLDLLVCRLRTLRCSVDQSGVNQMFTQKPSLKLIRTQNITNHHIVGPMVPDLVRLVRDLTAFADDHLVSIQQPRKHHRHLFPAPRWALDLRGLGHIRRHRDGQPAEQLNALGDGVHNFDLLAVMLVVKQMKLIESRADDLPMRFLVQITQCHRIREQLI